jgi:ABC-type antimicrobial peptide transport system permease subunit
MSMTDATSVSQLPVRLAGGLLAVLGGFALLLAAIGIFGVLSYIVRARTREIGVRVAIGASPRSVVTLILKQAMTWTITGAAIGLTLAFGMTRFLVSLLYGVTPSDPWTFAGVTFVLGAVACVAALVPTVRASRLDPLAALRDL